MPQIQGFEGINPLIANAGEAVVQQINAAQQNAAARQTQAMQAREWWRQKKLQSILSKHMNQDGSIDYKAGLGEASAADLLPDYRAAAEEHLLKSLQNQSDMDSLRQLAAMQGHPLQANVDESAQMPQVDTTGFTTPDMMPKSPAPVMVPDAPTKTVSGSKVVAGAPLEAPSADGEIRVTATAPSGQGTTLPDPGAYNMPPLPEKSYLGKFLEGMPQDPTADMLKAFAPGNNPAFVQDYANASPQYKATVRQKLEYMGAIPPNAPEEQVAAENDKFNALKMAGEAAKLPPMSAFVDPKTGRVDRGAYIKAVAEAKSALLKKQTEILEGYDTTRKGYSGESQTAQTLGNATTAAQNEAQGKQAERESIGNMVENSNKVAAEVFGKKLNPASFTDAKTADEVTRRFAAAGELVHSLKSGSFLTGSAHKVMADFNSMANTIQVIEGVPATEAGHRAIAYLGIPDMDLKKAIASGMIDPAAGLTPAGATWLSTQLTKTAAPELKKNIAEMISGSKLLKADIDKYAVPEGQKGPQNYGYAMPKRVDNPFGAQATNPTPAQIVKMSPTEAKKAIESEKVKEPEDGTLRTRNGVTGRWDANRKTWVRVK